MPPADAYLSQCHALLLEFLDPGPDTHAFPNLAAHSADGLEPVTRDHQHERLVRIDTPGFEQLSGYGNRDAARRLGEDSRRLRKQANAINQLLIAHILAGPARVQDCLDGIRTIGRIPNRE